MFPPGVGMRERVRQSLAVVVVALSSGCGHELVDARVDPGEVRERAGPVLPPAICTGLGTVPEDAKGSPTPNEVDTQALVGALGACGAVERALGFSEPGKDEALLEARLTATTLSEPVVHTDAREALMVASVLLIAPIPFNFIYTDREPELALRIVLEVGVRGEPAAVERYEVVARGTIRAQSPGHVGVVETHAQSLRGLATRAAISRFAADAAARERLRALLAADRPEPLELEALLTTKETFVPRARWRTRQLIRVKNETLEATLSEAKASELRALSSKLEACMVDLSHEAEVAKDLAEGSLAKGEASDEARALSLVYNERIEVLRPILGAVKGELDARAR